MSPAAGCDGCQTHDEEGEHEEDEDDAGDCVDDDDGGGEAELIVSHDWSALSHLCAVLAPAHPTLLSDSQSCYTTTADNEPSQSLTVPLLWPSPCWKLLLTLLQLRIYAKQAIKHGKYRDIQ